MKKLMNIGKQDLLMQKRVFKISYTARKKGHLLPSIQGIAWGETIKRFEACVHFINNEFKIDFICIYKTYNVDIDDVPESLRKIVKKQTLIDLFE